MALARITNDPTDEHVAVSSRVPTGWANEVVISETTFRNQQRAFNRNPAPPSKKRKREARGDSSVVYGTGAYKGPWARYEEVRPDVQPADADDVDAEDVEEVEEVSEYEEDALPEYSLAKPSKNGTAYAEMSGEEETSEFLGDEMYDYQGRTYMNVPKDLNINLTTPLPPYTERRNSCPNYCPKKLIHTWKAPNENKAHTRAITQTRFFPDSGHLLLTSGADSKIFLWDVYHQRRALRSFNGHTKSVSDIDFAPDGDCFLSASYDRQMKLWNTETGACLSRYSTGATPHVIRFNPSQPHEFIAGMSDKKIVQFDTRADDKKPIQEYDHHLGPVNTLTFYDNSQRFLSAGDDRTLHAWDVGIPVPTKRVSGESLFSYTSSAMHPSGKYVAYQSSDNQVVVYNVSEKLRQNRKKTFTAHNVAGHAIQIGLSPDGGILASGDTLGGLYMWDWRTGKLWNRLDASKDGATVALSWHPRESSRIVTGDTAGNLRYWD